MGKMAWVPLVAISLIITCGSLVLDIYLMAVIYYLTLSKPFFHNAEDIERWAWQWIMCICLQKHIILYVIYTL